MKCARRGRRCKREQAKSDAGCAGRSTGAVERRGRDDGTKVEGTSRRVGLLGIPVFSIGALASAHLVLVLPVAAASRTEGIVRR